jgi:hypothetical protein
VGKRVVAVVAMTGLRARCSHVVNVSSGYSVEQAEASGMVAAQIGVELGNFNNELLSALIEEAPHYTRLREVFPRVVRVVHGTPLLVEGADLSEVEVYVGRAGLSEEYLSARFRYRARLRGHEFGTVICTCPTTTVPFLEGGAVRILDLLRRRGKLCVANVSTHGGGSLPRTRTSAIYMTWGYEARGPVGSILRDDLDPLAAEAARGDRHASLGDVRQAIEVLADRYDLIPSEILLSDDGDD